MDVFVIPVAADRYELYCEQPVGENVPIDPPRSGLIGTLRHRIAVFLHSAEERQRNGPASDAPPKGLVGKLQDRMMAWVAERIAEQRLLWNLRGETSAVAAHPNDMTFDQVNSLIRRTLQRDYERHRKWVFIDGLLFLVTFVALGPIFILIPGIANLPALYFGFRAIGHFFSMRGALHGLREVTWTGRPCPPLGELRELAVLEPADRDERIHDIAMRLRLQHLSTFFDRVAIHHA